MLHSGKAEQFSTCFSLTLQLTAQLVRWPTSWAISTTPSCAILAFLWGLLLARPLPLLHTLSLVIFLIIYMLLCLRILRAPQRISTLQSLVRWFALVCLAY